MNDSLKIYIDRLKDGHIEKIDESIDPCIIFADVTDIQFSGPIRISGDVYLADGEIIFLLDIHTQIVMPCSVCNENVAVNIDIIKVYNVLEMASVKGSVFDMRDMIREMVLLEVPTFVECHGQSEQSDSKLNQAGHEKDSGKKWFGSFGSPIEGQCPKRKEVEKYLKNEESAKMRKIDSPFDGLSSEMFKK